MKIFAIRNTLFHNGYPRKAIFFIALRKKTQIVCQLSLKQEK